MLLQQHRVALTELADEPCRGLDVGEEEGDRARGQPAHPRPHDARSKDTVVLSPRCHGARQPAGSLLPGDRPHRDRRPVRGRSGADATSGAAKLYLSPLISALMRSRRPLLVPPWYLGRSPATASANEKARLSGPFSYSGGPIRFSLRRTDRRAGGPSPCSSALGPPHRADRGDRAQVLDQHPVDGESALA